MLDLKTGRYVFMSPTQVELTGFTAEEINNISAEEAYERATRRIASCRSPNMSAWPPD